MSSFIQSAVSFNIKALLTIVSSHSPGLWHTSGICPAKTFMSVFVSYSSRRSKEERDRESKVLCSITLHLFVWVVSGRGSWCDQNEIARRKKPECVCASAKVTQKVLKCHSHKATFSDHGNEIFNVFL